MRSIIIFLFFLLPITVSAQDGNSISAQVSISAELIRSIELITVNSITFGNTQPGQEEIYVSAISDVSAGYMIAVGNPGSEFRIDFIRQREVSRTDGPGYLTFEYELAGNTIEEQQSAILILDNENDSLKFNAEGRYHIWVGGRVNLTNAQPGNYEGDFTIEIDYI